MDEIDKPLLLAVLRRIEAREAIETARRVKQRIAKIYRFAISEGANLFNPADDINNALTPVPPASGHHALLKLNDIHKMLFTMDRAGASHLTRLASRSLHSLPSAPEWSEI